MGAEERKYLFENTKLKIGTILDFGLLYKRLFSWFEVMGYDFHETNYEQHDAGGGDLLKIFWVSTKTVDDYTKFVIKTNFFITGFKKVEVEKDGLKMKLHKCTIEMRMTAYMVYDVGDKMKKSIGVVGRRMYEKFIVKNRMDDHEIQLYMETGQLWDEIKGFVSMHKF